MLPASWFRRSHVCGVSRKCWSALRVSRIAMRAGSACAVIRHGTLPRSRLSISVPDPCRFGPRRLSRSPAGRPDTTSVRRLARPPSGAYLADQITAFASKNCRARSRCPINCSATTLTLAARRPRSWHAWWRAWPRSALRRRRGSPARTQPPGPGAPCPACLSRGSGHPAARSGSRR